MNIYLACGPTHVPRDLFDDYVELLHSAADELTKLGHSVKYALVNSDPQLAERPPKDRARLCYEWDRRLVEECDVLIAEATFPSTGLGIELQIAAQEGKPILIGFRRDRYSPPVSYENPDGSKHVLQIGAGHVSLMALGLPTLISVVEYLDVKELIAGICDVGWG